MTCRGAVGGAAAGAVVFTLGAGEKARDLPAPGNPVESPGPGTLGEVALSGSPLTGRKAALGTGVPPPAASFPDLPGCARAAPALSPGLRRELPAGCTGLSPEDPLEKRERGGSARPPGGQAAGPGLWSDVLR